MSTDHEPTDTPTPAPHRDRLLPVLRREAVVPSSDRARLAAILATCSLAGLAGGLALSMVAGAQRAAASMPPPQPRLYLDGDQVRTSADPVTWLGLQLQDCGPRQCADGAAVARVWPDSPAQAAGFHTGDVVVRFAGDHVASDDALISVVRASSVGAQPEIVVTRGSTEVALHPTLGVMPDVVRSRVFPPADAHHHRGYHHR